jgi:hypothetical protein
MPVVLVFSCQRDSRAFATNGALLSPQIEGHIGNARQIAPIGDWLLILQQPTLFRVPSLASLGLPITASFINIDRGIRPASARIQDFAFPST